MFSSGKWVVQWVGGRDPRNGSRNAQETGLLVLSLLLFPDGQLPGRRWRWLVWRSVLLTSVGAVWQAFTPGVILSLGPIRNPLGIEGFPKANDPVQAIMFALMFVVVAS